MAYRYVIKADNNHYVADKDSAILHAKHYLIEHPRVVTVDIYNTRTGKVSFTVGWKNPKNVKNFVKVDAGHPIAADNRRKESEYALKELDRMGINVFRAEEYIETVLKKYSLSSPILKQTRTVRKELERLNSLIYDEQKRLEDRMKRM